MPGRSYTPGGVDRDRLRRLLQKQAVPPSATARAEEQAAETGSLDVDDRSSLRVIEGKFEHMATRAELTETERRLQSSIEQVRRWGLGLIIALLVAVIGVLLRLLMGLALHVLTSQPPLPPVVPVRPDVVDPASTLSTTP